MAATKSQGKTFTIFMVGLTTAAAGIAYFASGGGKFVLGIGIILIAYSGLSFAKIKPAEGKPALGSQPAVLKLGGICAALAGWLIVLFGLHLTPSVSGRMITSLIGLAVSLIGILILLPIAANKNAIWKS